MESIECSVNLDCLNSKISISGLSTPLEINYSEDIDFTQLVKSLCASFDTKRTINIQYPEDLSNYSDKEKIVLETVKSIFNSFNEKIVQTDDDNLESEQVNNTSDEPVDDTADDLPF